MRRLARRLGQVAALLGASAAVTRVWASEDHAELHGAIERVADVWRGVGATVVVGETRFLNDGETAAFVLPGLPDGRCTTVLLLGARGLGFHLTMAPSRDDDPNQRVPSEAGAVSIERCGDGLPHRLLVTSDSGRGALESLVARSDAPLPHLHAILPERTEAPTGPLPEPGLLPPLPPPDKRADLAETRAKRDGAAVLPRTTLPAGPDGAGAAEETLEPGCHALALFALDPRASHPLRRGKLDLDAELRDSSDDRLLARDRTDAPDAQLTVCLGDPTRVNILFAGSPPDGPVLMSHGAWPLPRHLPSLWGGEAQARMARVLLTRHVVTLPSDAVLLAQGGSGSTDVPLTIEPGGCYLAIVSLVQGAGHTVGLRVHLAARDVTDDRGVDDNGAAVAFCAGARATALAEVDARGTPLLGWGLAVYRLQSGIWGGP